MQFPQLPKISSNVILAAAIFVVLLFSMADMVMLLSYSGQTTAYFVYLNQKADMMNQSSENNTYKAQVAEYLAYLNNRINTTSQQASITSEGYLSRINSLEESNKNLKNQFWAFNQSIQNLTGCIATLNFTNTTNVIYYNTTTQIPVQQSCRQYLMNKYGLGPLFDVVACCNNLPPVGYSQECCTCYQ